MGDLLEALDALTDDWTEIRDLVNQRDRQGGPPLQDFIDDLDNLLPELAELCDRVWMLELVIRLCRMRRNI